MDIQTGFGIFHNTIPDLTRIPGSRPATLYNISIMQQIFIQQLIRRLIFSLKGPEGNCFSMF